MKISKTNNYELIAKLNKYIHDFHVDFYPKFFKEYNYENIEFFFKRIIDKEEFTFLLLEDDDEAIGYAWIETRNYPENAFKKPYRSVFVHHISISKDHRKKGYGSKLMEAIYELAKSNGIHRIELDYWSDNEIAKIFYQKNDFLKYREFVYKDIE